MFACPNGEPSKCRYYRNPNITGVTNVGACMYYYCTNTDEGPADECCQYYNGSIGISLAHASYIENNPRSFSDFANTDDAAMECVDVANYLKTRNWHNEWWEDDTLDAYGNPPARAYINFEILRLEFSTTYGLFLIASNGDQLNIAKFTDEACNEPSASDDCYYAEFQPINSKTLLTIRAEEQFGLDIDTATTRRRLRSRSGYRMLQAGEAEKRNTLVTVKQAKQEHIAPRFSESCDKCVARPPEHVCAAVGVCRTGHICPPTAAPSSKLHCILTCRVRRMPQEQAGLHRWVGAAGRASVAAEEARSEGTRAPWPGRRLPVHHGFVYPELRQRHEQQSGQRTLNVMCGAGTELRS